MTSVKSNNLLQQMITKSANAALKKLELPKKQAAQGKSKTKPGPKNNYKFNAKDSYEKSSSSDRSTSKEFNLGLNKPKKKLKGLLQQGLESLKYQKTFNKEVSQKVETKTSGKVEGKYGQAEGDAFASAEVTASTSGGVTLDTHGLDARVKAKAGVEAVAQAFGKLTSVLNVFGLPIPLGLEGKAKASAKVAAEADASVQITHNPPTAITQGSLGVSAVAKVEGEVKASAGPFSVKATGYASAGAEARVSWDAGIKDGKLQFSVGGGASVGFGSGYDLGFEVDLKQLGNMAKNMFGGMAKNVLGGMAKNVFGNMGQNTVEQPQNRLSNMANLLAIINTVDEAAKLAKRLFNLEQ